jgi:hypothetical protein
MSELTHFQRQTLLLLKAKSDRAPERKYGFLTSSIGTRRAAVCRRALGPLGLVCIEEISRNGFRYSITDAGRAALNDSEEFVQIGRKA